MLIWQIAEERAAQVRAALHERDIPFTVPAVEQVLEVDVHIDDTLAAEQINALLVHRQYQAPRIYVSEQLGRAEHQYIRALMCGHVVERTTAGQEGEYSFTERHHPQQTPHRFYAETFADALLMPEHIVRDISPEFRQRDALELALSVDVPIPVAKRRIHHCSLRTRRVP